jgi:hypothetical protein
MGSLFQGSPQTATSYVDTTTQTPRWMQDAIFNQVQLSQNIANKPFQSYQLPTVADLSPLQQQAYTNVQSNQGAYLPDLNTAQAGLRGIAGLAPTANTLASDIPTNITTGVAQAQPFFDKADVTSYSNITDYMNPYEDKVMDRMAVRSGRNLSENLLPAVSDAFIKAGQFGSSRMGDFGSRALRDEQESLQNAQANLLNTGYQQAIANKQSDLSRFGTLGEVQARLQSNDLSRQSTALQNLAALGQNRQAMGYADTAALESAGAVQQAQMQRQLQAAEKEFLDQQLYPMQQADFLNTQLKGLAPITPTRTMTSKVSDGDTYSASPLAQIGSAYAAYRGLDALANG